MLAPITAIPLAHISRYSERDAFDRTSYMLAAQNGVDGAGVVGFKRFGFAARVIDLLALSCTTIDPHQQWVQLSHGWLAVAGGRGTARRSVS